MHDPGSEAEIPARSWKHCWHSWSGRHWQKHPLETDGSGNSRKEFVRVGFLPSFSQPELQERYELAPVPYQ